jgi:hypothetical protein
MQPKLTPPAVRFIRCYDAVNHRMLNVWEKLNTQAQIDNPPLAMEVMVQAQTFQEAMSEVEKYSEKFLLPLEIERIRGSFAEAENACDPLYLNRAT